MANFYGSLAGFGGGGEALLEFMSALGGDSIATVGDYKIHKFTSTGSGTFTPTIGSDSTHGSKVEYLVVASGGAGGPANADTVGSGGGGAGGYRTATGFTVATQAYTITVGAGGSGASVVTGNDMSSNQVSNNTTVINNPSPIGQTLPDEGRDFVSKVA